LNFLSNSAERQANTRVGLPFGAVGYSILKLTDFRKSPRISVSLSSIVFYIRELLMESLKKHVFSTAGT
jgi:hypothetical protein